MERPERPSVPPGTYHMLTLRQCHGLLKPLQKNPSHWLFAEPVDPVRLAIPDYLEIVKDPMDLGTVQKKLMANEGTGYRSVDQFVEDVRLVWYNAKIYNPIGSTVADAANQMSAIFEQRLATLVASAGDGGQAADGGLSLKNAFAIVRALMNNKIAWAFLAPVDPVKLGIPTYFEVVKNPMDLGTVNANLKAGKYETVGALKADINQVWDNAIAFNGPESTFGQSAETLRAFTNKKFAQEQVDDDAPLVANASAASKSSRPSVGKKRSLDGEVG